MNSMNSQLTGERYGRSGVWGDPSEHGYEGDGGEFRERRDAAEAAAGAAAVQPEHEPEPGFHAASHGRGQLHGLD